MLSYQDRAHAAQGARARDEHRNQSCHENQRERKANRNVHSTYASSV